MTPMRFSPCLSRLALFMALALPAGASAGEQPTAILHAFDLPFRQVEEAVCRWGKRGWSHVQISPAQQSHPGPFAAPMGWARRYQPVDHGVIAGLGTEQDLRRLIRRAHDCGVRVIADVVFNHMADLDGRPEREDPLRFPGLGRGDFNGLPGVTLRRPCRDGDSRVPGRSGYDDSNRESELGCWLGSLPDLVFTANVKRIQKDHLDRLLRLGIDGFRFDAAKHMPPQVLKEYVDHVDGRSHRRTWNYLEVIQDADTRGQDYAWIAAVTDFVLYGSLRRAFSWGGDLRSLPAVALADPRSVTFGRSHDNLAEIRVRRQDALDPWSDAADAWLASAYVLARQDGTPLVLAGDAAAAPYLSAGALFRRILAARGREGRNVSETILRPIDRSTVLLLQRGAEGFAVINKGADRFDQPVLDLTLSDLEGCYRELRSGSTMAVERRGPKKFVTRWGSWSRGGLALEPRDALFFVREPFAACHSIQFP
ncbi:MAG: alpha-amylase family glycosyl hydrolase [Cyanobium sp.]